MKRSLIKIILIFFLLFININVFARINSNYNNGHFIVYLNPYKSWGGSIEEIAYQDTGARVFCIKKDATTPAIGVMHPNTTYSCSNDLSTNKKNWKVAVGYAIHHYNKGNLNYGDAQKIIQYVSNLAGSGSSIELNVSQGRPKVAVQIYNNYGKEYVNFKKGTNLNLRKNGNYYRSDNLYVDSYTPYMKLSYVLKVNGAESDTYQSYIKTNSDGSVYLQIPVNGVKPGDNIKFYAKVSATYKVAKLKYCGSGIQPIALTTDIVDEKRSANQRLDGTIPVNYTVKFYGNGGKTSEGNQYVNHVPLTVSKGEKDGVKIITNPFIRTNYTFANVWNVYRSDGTWYVKGVGWLKESDINKNNYKKHTYTSGQKITLSGAWILESPLGAETNEEYTYTFYAQWNLDSKKLTINKKYKRANGEIGKVISTTRFGIYKTNNCTGDPVQTLVTNNGTGSVTLDPDIYYVKETDAPSGYILSNECKVVNLKTSDQDIDFFNVGGCEVKVADIKALYAGVGNTIEYKKELIKLYNEEKASGHDYRKLLNFNNPECKIKTDCYSKKDNECLNVNYVNDGSFSENDWSCYNDTIKDTTQNIIGYCSTTFNIQKNIQPKNGYYSVINAGQLLMANKNPVTKASVNSTCYSLGSTISQKGISIPNLTLAGTNIKANNTNNIIFYTMRDNAYVGQLDYQYNLPNVYAKKISGKLKDEDGNLYTENCLDCTNLGTGIPSRFNEGTGSVRFNYSWIINYETISGGSDCNYKINPEIIKYDKEPKGQMQLEFRTIDTKEPFSRTAKSNWCTITNGIKDCTSNNKIITDTIKNKTNSYGMNNGVKQTPKYTITLSSSDITNIREYNKNNKYDDYLFKCEDGVCKSNFLTSLKDGAFGSKLITH